VHSRTPDFHLPAARSYDKTLLFVMLALVIFGTIMIYSSTAVVTPLLEKKNISEFYYIKRHMLTMVLGAVALVAAYKAKAGLIEKLAVPLLVLSGLLLLLVFVPHIGVRAGGAQRWLKLGFTTFQPSELVKLAMVVFLARYLSRPEYNPDNFLSFAKPLVIMAAFQAVFLKQPDFGATMSLFILTLGMLFIAGTRIRYLASLLVLVLPVIVKLAMEPYRLRRITSFLDPWKDPQGSGFQLIQSFISLGSGGLTGLGLGESKQKLSYLPAKHTDFIFCLVGEELGLVGASIVIALFLVLFMRGVSIANRTKDRFHYFLAYGLTMMIAVQALVNFSVVTGMVPTKGLPLPFMSYGGSALLVNMAVIGLLLRISRGDEAVSGAALAKDIIARKVARRNIYSAQGAGR
jgi:cell division protein FtsW